MRKDLERLLRRLMPAGTAHIELKDAEISTEGFLRCKAVVTGISVLDYSRSYGVHMFRSEAEVFNPESMASLKGKPVTLGHPSHNLTSETTRDHIIGYTGDEVWREGDQLCVNFTLIDADIIRRVLEKLAAGERVQFSCGYRAHPIPAAGEYQGQAYQVMQTQIEYNHLALLLDQNGRYPHTELLTDSDAGSALLFMDGELTAHITTQKEDSQPVEYTLKDGTVINVKDEAEGARIQKIVDAAENKASEAKGALKIAEKKAAKQLKDAADAKAAHKAHNKLCHQAALMIGDSADLDELLDMDERQVHEAVLLHDGQFSEDELQAMDAGEIRGAYRILTKTLNASDAATDDMLDAAGKGTQKTRTQRQAATEDLLDAAEEAKSDLHKRMQALRKGKKAE